MGILVEEDSEGEGLVFARYEADINSTELGMRLIREYSVEIVPGDHFGMDRHLRFSFGLPEDYLLEGLDRISQVIATLRREQKVTRRGFRYKLLAHLALQS